MYIYIYIYIYIYRISKLNMCETTRIPAYVWEVYVEIEV
jgi:hypothetical protein